MVQSGRSVPSVQHVQHALRPRRRQRTHVPHHQRPRDFVKKRNTRERCRVHGVNQAFEALRQHLPLVCLDDKTSKISIIRHASNYIMRLTSLLQDMDDTAPGLEGSKEEDSRERVQCFPEASYSGVSPFFGDSRNEAEDCEQIDVGPSQEKNQSNHQHYRVQSLETRHETGSQKQPSVTIPPSSILNSEAQLSSSSARLVSETMQRNTLHVQRGAYSAPHQAMCVWRNDGTSFWWPSPSDTSPGVSRSWTNTGRASCCQTVAPCHRSSCHQSSRSYCHQMSSYVTPARRLLTSDYQLVTSSVTSDYYSELYGRAQPYAIQKMDSSTDGSFLSSSDAATTSSCDVPSSSPLAPASSEMSSNIGLVAAAEFWQASTV